MSAVHKLAHTLLETHRNNFRVNAGTAAIRECVFLQFYQPLNPCRTRKGVEKKEGGENKDIKMRDIEPTDDFSRSLISPGFVLDANSLSALNIQEEE